MNYSPIFFLFFFLLLSACEEPERPWTKYPDFNAINTIAKLPNSVPESSGLIYWQKELWTINDSGGGPLLFQVGMEKKEKTKKIKVKGIANTDWESMAQDSQFIYIGDFGNNAGKRQDLTIHLVKKAMLSNAKKEVPNSGSISFTYPDQESVKTTHRSHNFDCEAMISIADSLYLFSKNHKDKHTKLYRLAKQPGQYQAQLLDRFNTDGKITGAAFAPDKKLLVLLGYNNIGSGHRPFLWLFYDYPASQFFAGKHQRINLPVKLQTEAIAHFSKHKFLLTNEMERGGKGKVFLVDLKELLE